MNKVEGLKRADCYSYLSYCSLGNVVFNKIDKQINETEYRIQKYIHSFMGL